MPHTRATIKDNTRRAHYFSDRCAGQYKNFKNFLNVCLHEREFKAKCQWTFFATSQGKSPCDGVGGAIKQLATRAGLQGPQKNQIVTATRLLEFCQEEICGIKVYFLDKDSLTLTRES